MSEPISDEELSVVRRAGSNPVNDAMFARIDTDRDTIDALQDQVSSLVGERDEWKQEADEQTEESVRRATRALAAEAQVAQLTDRAAEVEPLRAYLAREQDAITDLRAQVARYKDVVEAARVMLREWHESDSDPEIWHPTEKHLDSLVAALSPTPNRRTDRE